MKSAQRNASLGLVNHEDNVVRSAVTDPTTRTPSSLGGGESSGAVIACSVLRASLTLIPACYYISAIPGGRRRSGGQQCELHGSSSIRRTPQQSLRCSKERSEERRGGQVGRRV